MAPGASSPKHYPPLGNSIAIIEDDAAIRDSLGLFLENEGYEVVKAADGKEGLELLNGVSKPGLILLDLLMPVMDGWQFLEAMEQDRSLASIPVAIITAYADRSHGIKCKDILKKPLDLDALLTLVRKHCGPPHGAKSGVV